VKTQKVSETKMTYNFEMVRRDYIEIDKNGLFICPFCSEPFRALAYHTRQVHKVSGRQLREMFGLPYNYPLQTKDLIERRREMALRYNMDKQLIRTGKKTRFKKERKMTKEQINSISKGHKKDIRMITGDAI